MWTPSANGCVPDRRGRSGSRSSHESAGASGSISKDNPDHESVVVVSFDPHGDRQTLMTIEHRLLPANLTEQHEEGWARIAKQLSTRLRAITVS
jgi:hypothetical protein